MRNWLVWTLIQGANACNIITGILIAHALTPDDFGRFATMAASLTILAALLNPLINELAHSVSQVGGISYHALGTRSLWTGLAGITMAMATCLSITRTWTEQLTMLLVLPLSMISWSWMTGILIGKNEMPLLAKAQSVGALFRLVVVGAVLTVSPALSYLALAYVISFVAMTLSAAPAVRSLQPASQDLWKTNWGLVVGFFLLAAPFSLDQPIVQLWFPALSGNYAAVMTYAKSIMLLSSPALTIAYSSALQRRATRISPAAFVKLVLSVAGVAGFFWLSRPLFFPLLLGPRYLDLLPMVGYALLAISFHVISYALAQVQLAGRALRLIVVLSIAPITQALCLKALSAPTLEDLCMVSVVVFAVQLCVVLCVSVLPSRASHA